MQVIEKWMDGVKDFLMKEQAVQGDAEGLQSQLDQCSVSSADLGTAVINNISFCFFVICCY